jgi:NitT/TauT family transport system substrate-binding protein
MFKIIKRSYRSLKYQIATKDEYSLSFWESMWVISSTFSTSILLSLLSSDFLLYEYILLGLALWLFVYGSIVTHKLKTDLKIVIDTNNHPNNIDEHGTKRQNFETDLTNRDRSFHKKATNVFRFGIFTPTILLLIVLLLKIIKTEIVMKNICACFLAISLFFSGCKHDEQQVVKIAYLPSLAASQLYVGIAKGYFEEEGIKVEISEIYNGPDIIAAVQSKTVDIGFGITPPLILARSNGAKIKSIGGATFDGISVQEHRLMLPIDSEIKSPQDLKGKKIAVVAEGTSDYFGLIGYLEKNGIKKNEVEIISVPHPEMIFAISNKSVDAAAGIEPFITMGSVQGKTKTFDFYYPDQEMEVGTFIAHEDFISSNSDLVAKIIKVIEKSTIVINNEKEFRALLPTLETHGIKFKITKEVADKVQIMGFRDKLTTSGTGAVMDMLFDNHILKNKFDVQECIYTSPKNKTE